MSEKSPRDMRDLPAASQPCVGQRIVPDQFVYIPGQERTFQHQPNISNPQYLHPTAPPMFSGGDSRPRGIFPSHPPPPPPPPIADPHSLPSLPPHLGNPPPMFSRPPPPVPARFPQPPSSMPHTPSIPFQAAFHNSPMISSQEGSFTWQQHNPPPAPPPCPQMQANINPTSTTTHPGKIEEMACRDMVGFRDEEDSKWLEEFERRVKSCPPPPPSPTESTTTTTAWKNVKLAEVQRRVVEACALMKQLSDLEKEMSQGSTTAQDEEWSHLVHQTETVKVRLNQILENFQDQGFVEHIKMLVKQRRTKRNRVKRRKREIKLEKEELKRKRKEEEDKIDAWRAKLQREEDSRRREEAVKREADSVLGEVRQKQNESHRMMQLLEALAGLRATRATQAVAQGRPKDPEAEQRFTTTTEMIAKILKHQQKEYELEEQTLRVMMEESATHRSAALSAKRDSNFARYEDSIRKLMFGATAAPDNPEDASTSLQTLVQRRQEWDKYVVGGSSPLASVVPLSWVLPPVQPQPDWAAFLKR